MHEVKYQTVVVPLLTALVRKTLHHICMRMGKLQYKLMLSST